jgi:hypothetical protein
LIEGTVWLGKVNQGVDQPEIPLAKEMPKVKCEGHPLVEFCSESQMSVQKQSP